MKLSSVQQGGRSNAKKGLMRCALLTTIFSNLIDISSAQNEPLQDQDVEERTERYRKVLDETSSMQNQAVDTIALSTSLPLLETLADIKPNQGLDQSDVEWLYKAMDDIRDALQKFEINPVGEVVVNLTMTENSVLAIRG